MNEFKVKKGLIVQGSGSTLLDIQGSQGQLFSVTDSLSGSLFSVNDISGMPIMEVFSDDRVLLGTFNAEAIKVSGSTATVTGSLFGTSSYATQALTASNITPAINGNVNNRVLTADGDGTLTGEANLTFDGTLLYANSSFIQGGASSAAGADSHAEGKITQALGDSSHAEGRGTQAIGDQSHAEGRGTQAIGNFSHAEGEGTNATGYGSHAEGLETLSSGDYSHAEGLGTVSSGSYQHTQGQYNISSSAQSAFIIGNGTSDVNRSNLVFASGSQFQVTGSLIVSNDSLINRVSIGVGAGGDTTNTILGREALQSNIDGTENIAVGDGTLKLNTSGYQNTAIGQLALTSNSDGYQNTAIGKSALTVNETGIDNIAVGVYTLGANIDGNANTAIGNYALSNNDRGYSNIAIGNYALSNNTRGYSSIGIGQDAGNMDINYNPTQDAINSIYIGNSTRTLVDSSDNEIVIGYNAVGNGTNTTTIGNDSTTATYLKGHVSASIFSGSLFGTASFATTASSVVGYYKYINTAQSVGSNTSGETQMISVEIPANSFAASDKFYFRLGFSKVGVVNTATIRVKLTTSSSMPSGATSQIAIAAIGNTVLYAPVERNMAINGGNLKGFGFTSSNVSDSVTSAVAWGSVAFDVTQTQYFYVSITPAATTTDVTYLEFIEITNI